MVFWLNEHRKSDWSLHWSSGAPIGGSTLLHYPQVQILQRFTIELCKKVLVHPYHMLFSVSNHPLPSSPINSRELHVCSSTNWGSPLFAVIMQCTWHHWTFGRQMLLLPLNPVDMLQQRDLQYLLRSSRRRQGPSQRGHRAHHAVFHTFWSSVVSSLRRAWISE